MIPSHIIHVHCTCIYTELPGVLFMLQFYKMRHINSTALHESLPLSPAYRFYKKMHCFSSKYACYFDRSLKYMQKRPHTRLPLLGSKCTYFSPLEVNMYDKMRKICKLFYLVTSVFAHKNMDYNRHIFRLSTK